MEIWKRGFAAAKRRRGTMRSSAATDRPPMQLHANAPIHSACSQGRSAPRSSNAAQSEVEGLVRFWFCMQWALWLVDDDTEHLSVAIASSRWAGLGEASAPGWGESGKVHMGMPTHSVRRAARFLHDEIVGDAIDMGIADDQAARLSAAAAAGG